MTFPDTYAIQLGRLLMRERRTWRAGYSRSAMENAVEHGYTATFVGEQSSRNRDIVERDAPSWAREGPGMSAREIHVVLSELKEVLVERGITSLGLRPPASDSAIKEFEETIGVVLPADYREFLRIGDGQEAPSAIALLPGGHFGPLEALAACWRDEKDQSDEGYEEEEACGDDDPIRLLRYHPLRIPIGGSPWLDGDNAYLDLTPGPAGHVGQVIGLVTECDFIVLGLCVTDYLERVTALLRSGQIEVLRTDPGPRFTKANKQNQWERWDGLLMSR